MVSTRDLNIGINKQVQASNCKQLQAKQSKEQSKAKMASANVVSQLDSLAAELASMQESLSNLKVSEKKPRKVSEKGILQAAKLLYYHDNKKSESVMAVCRAKYGADFKITLLNFRKAQKVTDDMFDELSESDKSTYMEAAKIKKGCA